MIDLDVVTVERHRLGDPNDHGPACSHPSRYRTSDGRWLCELCEQLRTGWGVCPLCVRFEPLIPDPFNIGEDISLCADCVGGEAW